MNPFRDKATRARAAYERTANVTSAHERGMAESFPLGAGFGRRGDSQRIERTISRACDSVRKLERARYLEAQADSYDRGEINAQGRRWNAERQQASDKRAEQKAKRDARQAAAQAVLAANGRKGLDPATWADAHGYFGGSGRALVMADQEEWNRAE